MIDTGLTGRVALITGANHGIGAETARTLAKEGAKVFLTYLRVELDIGDGNDEVQEGTTGRKHYKSIWKESGKKVVDTIRTDGGMADSWEADLANSDCIGDIFDRAEAAFGPVEILVNNATHWENSRDTILTTSAEILDRYFAVNTRGTALMMKEFLVRHRERKGSWGRIVNLSQDCAQVSGEVGYSSTKATIEMLTRSAVEKAGPFGVTVNAVAPGPVQTGYMTPEEEAKIGSNLALRRVGWPRDLANAILFLCSTQADWITGQVIKVDGGSGHHLK